MSTTELIIQALVQALVLGFIDQLVALIAGRLRRRPK